MKSKFTPVSVVKQKRPAWMTPDFNPQVANERQAEFTPYAIIPLLLDYLRK